MSEDDGRPPPEPTMSWPDKRRYRKKDGSQKKRLRQHQLQPLYARELKTLNVHKPVRATSARHLKVMKDLKEMLKLSWDRVFKDMPNYSRFSKRQLDFFRHYAINGRRAKARCMMRAGYQYKNAEDAEKEARKYLALPHAEDLVTAFEFEEKAKMGLLVEDVANWFEKIALTAMEAGDFTNANRAMESYAKYLGMFVERKEVTHKTVHNVQELDARIAELQRVISEEKPNIERNITIN